mgnify:CR=1 FL=1
MEQAYSNRLTCDKSMRRRKRHTRCSNSRANRSTSEVQRSPTHRRLEQRASALGRRRPLAHVARPVAAPLVIVAYYAAVLGACLLTKWRRPAIVAAVLLFWIAVQLLVPEDEDESGIESSSNVFVAIRTILIADLVMSLDNVIGVAAAAKGNDVLVMLGLAISIPLIIFGSTILLKLMDRYPVIITGGAALLGWVAGEMIITDPAIKDWINANMGWIHIHLPVIGDISWAQIAGALIVIGIGKIMSGRKEEESEVVDLAADERQSKSN